MDFRSRVQKGTEFEPEAGRYVLYAGWFCPFASRVILLRKLKGLEDVVPLVIVNTIMDEPKRSWTFKRHTLEDRPEVGIAGTVPEPLYGLSYIRELYERHNAKHDPEAEVKPPYPVPTLWDRKLEKIVSNDSADMMRWFSTAWDDLLPPDKARLNFSPADLTAKMDELYSWGSRDVAGGVYRAGFATTQEAYDAAVPPVFAGLDRLESLLAKNGGPYIWGDRLTESDVWMYTCVVRFDIVYAQLFKCNLKTIRHDYPALHRWLRNLYWNHEAFKSTTLFDNI